MPVLFFVRFFSQNNETANKSFPSILHDVRCAGMVERFSSLAKTFDPDVIVDLLTGIKNL